MTRPTAVPTLAMTFVTEAFVYPEDWIEHLGSAAFLLFILTSGSGPIELDRWLAPLLYGRR